METHSFEILALSCFLSFVFLPFSFVCISGLLFLSFSADWHNDSPCIQREQPWADAATHILLFLNLVPLVSGLSCSLVCCFTLGNETGGRWCKRRLEGFDRAFIGAWAQGRLDTCGLSCSPLLFLFFFLSRPST